MAPGPENLAERGGDLPHARPVRLQALQGHAQLLANHLRLRRGQVYSIIIL